MVDKISLTLEEDSSMVSTRTFLPCPAVRLGGDVDAPRLLVGVASRSLIVKRLSVSLAAKSCLAREAAPDDISLSGIMREKGKSDLLVGCCVDPSLPYSWYESGFVEALVGCECEMVF